jgi:hypothetical protein
VGTCCRDGNRVIEGGEHDPEAYRLNGPIAPAGERVFSAKMRNWCIGVIRQVGCLLSGRSESLKAH